MNDEKLIELIRGYPVLYDPCHSKYMDMSYKLKIWNIIGKEMKESVSSCKARWCNIRDNFRKSMKKTATMSGQKKVKLYKYSEHLGFLIRYFKDRDTIGNIECKKDGEDNEEYEYVEVNIKDGIKESTASDEDEFLPNQLSLVPIDDNSSEVPKILATKKSIKKHVAPQPSESSQLMEYGTSTLHPVDAFLSGIGATLKSLSPYYLNLAKSEIFATVQKYELKMLMEQHEDPSSGHFIPWHYPNTTSTSVSSPKMSPADHQHE